MTIQTQIPGNLLKQGPQTEPARYARAYLAQRVARYLSITTPRKRALGNLRAHLECSDRTVLRLEAEGKKEKRDFEAEHDECPFEIERGFHALPVLAELVDKPQVELNQGTTPGLGLPGEIARLVVSNRSPILGQWSGHATTGAWSRGQEVSAHPACARRHLECGLNCSYRHATP